MRVYNFSAGPAQLPLEVLETAREELTDWKSSGMSVLEVSHRGKDFVAYAAQTEANLRSILSIPDNYKVLFLQGGASGEFDAVPLNLSTASDTVQFVNTGQWSKKAIAGSKRQGLEVQILADEAASGYTTIPDPGVFPEAGAAAYLHYTPNETIGGVAFDYIPQSPNDLVADFSSAILSTELDVSKFGVIYAGAQKNMGPSGLTVVIVREDLLGKARPQTPDVWNWKLMAENDSMLNTPPTFGIYILGLVLDWIDQTGGLKALGERNRAKAAALYNAIDSSDFYANPVALNARSIMNIPFTLANADLDSAFLTQASAAGLTNLKGHRSVGGMRASIYNAMPLEGITRLIDFMTDFERRNG
ncbi:MAG: 3-phosphoserine/phosphohydroxythreonine transaminase [Propionibacteriaceae bacterium]|nr:3-phosphoserine/phosphohydroxythreonine transaminase [Propionibacteriaceae bacterium]